MVTVISRFRVRNGLEHEVREAFLQRPRLVENASGFLGIEVLSDAADPSIFLLVTRWTDEASFRAWHASDAHHASHKLIPKGLKLDASFTSVTIGNHLEADAEPGSLPAVVRKHAPLFSRWLDESDTVFVLLLTPDGSILTRNRAAQRVFPAGPSGSPALAIWDYLAAADVENLRQRLAAAEENQIGGFLLNVVRGDRSPISWEAQLFRCNGILALLGSEEHHHDAHFQTEVLKLTNDLAMTMREAAQQNRDLQEANKTIELLVRTDALTGLANRRMLEETLPRETARAARLNQSLSVLFADLDNFKSINDQFGHKAGDHVLKAFGRVVTQQMRSYALSARIGGDEFVLLLPGSSRAGAITAAERIRHEFASVQIAGCPRPATVSLGVASLKANETGEALLARADQALYRAKQKGGNRVEAA